MAAAEGSGEHNTLGQTQSEGLRVAIALDGSQM